MVFEEIGEAISKTAEGVGYWLYVIGTFVVLGGLALLIYSQRAVFQLK